MATFQPLGDQAVLAYCADERDTLQFAAAARLANLDWVVDVVQSYTVVAVFFDLDQISYRGAFERLEGVSRESRQQPVEIQSRFHEIPCCYELQLDLERVAEHTRLNPEEIIRLHTETEFTVYAIGFCPGFPYLGYLPPALTGVPRLATPRPRVEAGSVGLTGRQTGIYTEPRPAGWNLIGRTPLELVNLTDGYFPLRTGDRVRFKRIDEKEYTRLLGQRL
jgi:inhibitor of KinA